MPKDPLERESLLGSEEGASSDLEPAEDHKLKKVKNQVKEVFSVMQQNIEKVVERGEKLDDLQDKTEDLSMHSLRFKSSSKQLRRRLWWQRVKFIIAIVVIVLILVIAVVLILVSKQKPSEGSP